MNESILYVHFVLSFVIFCSQPRNKVIQNIQLGKVEWIGSRSSLVAFVRTQMRIYKTYLGFNHVSIPPAFYVRLILAKVLDEAFLYLHFWFELIWHKNIGANALVKCWWNWPHNGQQRCHVWNTNVLKFLFWPFAMSRRNSVKWSVQKKINEKFVMFLNYHF